MPRELGRLTPAEDRALGLLVREAALYLLTPSEGVRAIALARMGEHVDALRMASDPWAMRLRGAAEILLGRVAVAEHAASKETRLRLAVAELMALRLGPG